MGLCETPVPKRPCLPFHILIAGLILNQVQPVGRTAAERMFPPAAMGQYTDKQPRKWIHMQKAPLPTVFREGRFFAFRSLYRRFGPAA